MRIILDAMGGDNAPRNNVEGAVYFANENDLEVLLVGREEEIKKELDKHRYKEGRILVENATQIIEMEESPVNAVKQKRDSSIIKGIALLKEGGAEAFVSAGNTGAVVASSLLELGKLAGIDRPGIAAPIPTMRRQAYLIDVGANIDSKPRHLLHFAIMGSTYFQYMQGNSLPRVGLLNIGEEGSKGNELTRATYRLLAESNLNFIGNIEGRDIVTDKVDVIICDGFIGNIILKFAENLFKMAGVLLRREFLQEGPDQISSYLRTAYKSFKGKVDYEQYGGAPLLGAKKNVVISHGRSSPRAIKNALKTAQDFVRYKINEKIEVQIKENEAKG